jgi:hypothetical protein
MCKNLSFEECELTILRASVDKSEKIQGRELLRSPETKKIIQKKTKNNQTKQIKINKENKQTKHKRKQKGDDPKERGQ